MKDKQFKKFFKEEYLKENNCKVTLNDILPESHTNNLNDKLYKKYKNQKRMTKIFSFSSLITVVVMVVLVLGLSIKMNDYKNKLDYYPQVSEEALEFMRDNCDNKKDLKFICLEKIYDKYEILIYNGYKYNGKLRYKIYFYVINNFNENILISFNGDYVDDIYNYGCLGMVEIDSNQEQIIKIKGTNFERTITIYE